MYKNVFFRCLPISQPLLSRLNILAGEGVGSGEKASADSIQDFSFDLNGVLRACRGGVEVASWTADREFRVRFSAYPYRVWASRWQPCQGRLGTLKTPYSP